MKWRLDLCSVYGGCNGKLAAGFFPQQGSRLSAYGSRTYEGLYRATQQRCGKRTDTAIVGVSPNVSLTSIHTRDCI